MKILEVSLDGGKTYISVEKVVGRVWENEFQRNLNAEQRSIRGPLFVVELTAEGLSVQDDPYGDTKSITFKEI